MATVQQPVVTQRWQFAHGRELPLGGRGYLMGILNVTPDSFSDGGRHADTASAVAAARAMLDAGATIIDIGGESTRPGADAVDADTEQARILPIIAELAATTDALISVDTYRSETARKAVAAGAHVVNDVYGLHRDPVIAEVAAQTGAGLCIMHTGRERQKLADVIDDQFFFFREALPIAERAGVARDQIMLDPGFGFAKDERENFELMARLGELHALGYPWLAGTSRKRFLGAATGHEAGGRDLATAATTALLRAAGVSVLRVHDVAINHDALLVADAMLAARPSGEDAAGMLSEEQ